MEKGKVQKLLEKSTARKCTKNYRPHCNKHHWIRWREWSTEKDKVYSNPSTLDERFDKKHIYKKTKIIEILKNLT